VHSIKGTDNKTSNRPIELYKKSKTNPVSKDPAIGLKNNLTKK
jgi:hypothetical protein